MSLLALQRDVRAWLQVGGEDEAARFAPAARAGLAIYQNNYRAQLVTCLEESFPATVAWLGGEAFRSAAARHIDAVPPHSWTLDAYPQGLPATLADRYPDDPEVAELAALEVALGDAFVAADAEPVAADRLGAVDWDHAVLRFVPSLALKAVTTNAPAIWTAITKETAPPAAERLPEPGGLVVWRQAHLSSFRAVERNELDLLRLARTGSSFGALCEQIVERLGEADGIAAIGGWLGRWIADGLVSDIAEDGLGQPSLC